jgi:hypothetical protein
MSSEEGMAERRSCNVHKTGNLRLDQVDLLLQANCSSWTLKEVFNPVIQGQEIKHDGGIPAKCVKNCRGVVEWHVVKSPREAVLLWRLGRSIRDSG